MNRRISAALAGSSLLVLASTLSAHAQQAPQRADVSDATEEIIVTARRKEESLLDVPESVKAVTGADLQKYNIVRLSDVAKLVPGLQITEQSGFTPGGGSLRGLTFGASSFPSSAQFYINDAPIDSTVMYMQMYDIGQIEVLRGPQGTIRGKIADTGAITITTRTPDLDRIGGYVEGTAGSLHNTNLQAAIGAPIVQDKLAMRIAAFRDDNDDNGVHSLYNTQSPRRYREGARATVRLAPVDNLDAVVDFQHSRQREQFYQTTYYGPGNTAGGPPLTATNYQTIEPGISNDRFNFNDLEAKVNYTFAGQKLTSVTGWSKYASDIEQDSNQINQVPGLTSYVLPTFTSRKELSEDLRLSSVEPLFGRVDYTVGFYYDHLVGTVNGQQALNYSPGTFVGNTTNYGLILLNNYALPSNQNEHAVYGSLTVHITDKDEITGGLRYGLQEQHRSNTFGVIDTASFHPTLYNVEASHKFNQDLMVYLRTANTWRYGALNPTLVLTTAGNPIFFPYEFAGPPETSKDYEGGVKGSLFDKRLSFDLDYFHQVYHNYLGFPGGAAVWHLAGPASRQTATFSTFSLPAVPSATVDGIELSAAGKITRDWSVNGALSWANGRVSGNLPCNPVGITAGSSSAAALAALVAAGQAVNLCPGTGVTANVPRWNFNISSEYQHPITDVLDGFVRGLFNYHPSNVNTGFAGFTSSSYATLDLYLGVRDADTRWEVSLYGKNITDNQTMLATAAVTTPDAGIARLGFTGANSAGYMTTTTLVPRREFGITARYAFGSR